MTAFEIAGVFLLALVAVTYAMSIVLAAFGLVKLCREQRTTDPESDPDADTDEFEYPTDPKRSPACR